MNKKCDCMPLYKEVIEDVQKKMPEDFQIELAVSFFKTLGDNTRMRIICALKEEEMCAGDIAVLLDMTKTAVSHQLAVMRQMHQIKARRDGKNVFYSLDDLHVVEVMEKVFEHIYHISN